MIQAKAQRTRRRTDGHIILQGTKQNTNLTLLESFRGYLTNFSYRLQGFKLSNYFNVQDTKDSNQKTNAKVYLLGSELTLKEAHEIHQQIIWFTYKKNISISKSIHSDVGWGCLIRVAQMAWGHCLKKYFNLTHKKVQKDYIITSFLEERGAQFKYNIHRFIEKGMKMWKLKPGQWYSMTQVATILESLHEDSPLKGSENLKLKVYNEVVNLKELVEIFELPLCSCPQRAIFCVICQQAKKKDIKQSYFHKSRTSSNQNSIHLNKKHIQLIITTKLGKDIIDKTQFKILLQLMSLPCFNGCLGGMPEKARFLTGCYLDKVSYLDPHYVESAVDQMNLNKKMEVFQCKQMRYMKREDLDPEMGLCFYLSNQIDLQLLVSTIDRIRSEHESFDFLKYDWNNDNDFEILTNEEESNKKPKLKQHFEDLEQSFSDLNTSNPSIASSFLMQ